MTKISAEVVADSICNGHRITTMLCTFPRIILAEFNTHRMFSRNSASSRAIPFKKMVEAVMNDPFIPIAWQKDHSGMQGTEYFTSQEDIDFLVKQHLSARNYAVAQAELLHHHGVTKQMCNRYLEPFMWHTVLVTATEWENFFHLRCPQYKFTEKGGTYRSWKDLLKFAADNNASTDWIETWKNYDVLQRLQLNKGQAEIHMMALAEAMWDVRNESKPKELQPGEWHIPYGNNIDEDDLINAVLDVHAFTDRDVTDSLIKVATARAGRTSYTVVGEEGKVHDYKKDIELHDRLLASGHMSPFEHCAQAMSDDEFQDNVKGVGFDPGSERGFATDNLSFPDEAHGWCHNYRGWKSYRSMIPNENRR